MGASSSRTKRTHVDVSHFVNEEVTTTLFSKNTGNKINNNGRQDINTDSDGFSNKRNSVKSSNKKNKNQGVIKKKWSLKKSKSVQGHDSLTTDFLAVTTGEPATGSTINASSVYYKSSCVSREDQDIQLGKNRSRSGSEKSLRFSDFNKVIRRTTVDEWHMSLLDIPLTSVKEPRLEEICYICEVYTGSQVRACRVCCHAYHDSCLAKIGKSLPENHRRLIATNKWSCHKCTSLNYLLTQQEVTCILEQLHQLHITRENITEADYVRFCGHSLQLDSKLFTSETEQTALMRFRSVAGTKATTITDSQLLELESIRVLGRRCKNSLVRLLTEAELANAKKIFQDLDVNADGAIYRSAVQSLQIGMSRTAAHFPDDSIMYMDEDLDSLVTWSDFLRDMAIHFLGQRPNSDDTGSQCNINDGGSLTFSSCGSLNVNDKQCSMHNSALEPSASNRKSYPLRSQERYPDEPAEEIFCDRFTMMDEINSEIDRCSCLHQSDEGHIHAWKQLHGTFDGVCSFPHPPAALCTDSSHLRKSARNPRDSTAGCWAETGTRDCTNMCQSSPYKDSRQDPIPWEDVETKPAITGKGDMRVAHATSRKSEILVRQTGISSGQTRAMSQLAYSPGLVSNSSNVPVRL